MADVGSLLEVEDLHTEFSTERGLVRAVDGVSFTVSAGERVGIVGESGSGKTVLALSVLGLVPSPGRVVAGRVLFRGRDVLAMDDESRRRLRGADLAMSFQDPMSSLHPLMRVRAQVREAMACHDRFPGAAANQRVIPLLRRVRIPAPEARAAEYPHQFSGGMRQRAMIAMGISNDPGLLIADEATTALDVTVQAQIVSLLGELTVTAGTALMLITHNLGLAAMLCDRLIVMYAGRVVEDGPLGRIFEAPQHPYTWYLLQSVPRLDGPRLRRLVRIAGAPPDLAHPPSGCTFHPRCAFRVDRCRAEEPPLGGVGTDQRARCWVLMDNVADTERGGASHLPAAARSRRAAAQDTTVLRVDEVAKHYRAPSGELVRAVDGVTFAMQANETLALIGESGCGKSSLARVIAGLSPATAGRVVFEGVELAAARRSRAARDVRGRLQMIFQDPFSSLDPRMTVAQIVAEPLANFGWKGDRRRDRVRELLDLVGLGVAVGGRYPHELSGGQRQRVGIARALAPEPSLVICDEPVSSLDVSIQAQILNLLLDLRDELGLTYLFISHDLGVVRHVADRVAVMYLGVLVEVADATDLYRQPRHPYTRALLDAVPSFDPALKGRPVPLADTEPPSPADPPAGCRFHPRCPIARLPDPCATLAPELEADGTPARLAACHFAGDF